MEYIWHYTESGKPKRYHEARIDLGLNDNKNSVFFESPFALGMVAVSTQSTEKMMFPFPATRGNSEDPTTLKLGERGIINPLWQYNDLADPRTAGKSGINFGRVYNQKIRPNNPIVFIQPGRPKFIGAETFFLGGGKKDADGLRSALADKMVNEQASPYSIADLVDSLSSSADWNAKNPARFYDFEPDFNSFRVYVRAIMEELRIRMNIGDVYTSQWLGSINSSLDIFTQFMEYYGFQETLQTLTKTNKPLQSAFLPFRVEKSTDASDNFSNSTGQSTAAQQIRGQTDNAKEIHFLTGGGSQDSREGLLSKAVSGAISGLGGLTGNISQAAETVIKTGGNMLFPEIWKDSSYSKTLNITIKCHAPYGNKLCIYENVIFPMACCLALAMPRQQDNSVYVSPPLVRMFSKGWFSCDMGLIEQLSFKRGNDRNDWTVERLPRTVEITLTVKDLFGSIMMSLGGSSKDNIRIFHKRNTALRDYLNVIGGIDTFADAEIGNQLKQRWEHAIGSWKQAIDPKNIIINTFSNPVFGPALRFATTFFV